jgi:hypothetical protein
MSDKRKISGYARRFVARKFEQFKAEANKGCGLHYELYAQAFSDRVDGHANRTKRKDLREYIQTHAAKDGDYFSDDGRWAYDHESGDISYSGPDHDAIDKGQPLNQSGVGGFINQVLSKSSPGMNASREAASSAKDKSYRYDR